MRGHRLLCMFSPMRCQQLSSCASCSSECVIPTTVHDPHCHALSPSQAPSRCIIPIKTHGPHHSTSSPPQCIIPIIVHHPHQNALSPSPCIVTIFGPSQCITSIILHHPHHSASSPSKSGMIIRIKVHGPHHSVSSRQSVFPSHCIIPMKAWHERQKLQSSTVFFFLQAAAS